jgi:putative hemolysin
MNATTRTDLAPDRPFRFDVPPRGGWAARLAALASPPLERLTALDALNDIYRRVTPSRDPRTFLSSVLADLRVTHTLTDGDLDRIPRKGPVVVVANHPFGAIEGIILAELLTRVRPDVKVMANYLLARIPELHDLFLFVDPFGGPASARNNLAAMRQSLRHLANGGLLVVFPAGEVSSLDLRRREVTDRPWTPMVARLVRRGGAAVVPVYFGGRNGALFQLAGLLHPRLRTALLPRQLLGKRRSTIDVRIGRAIPHRKLKPITDDPALTDHLRQRTYVLRHRGAGEVAAAAAATTVASRVMRPVAHVGDVSAMAAEIDALPPDQRLVDADDNLMVIARAQQIPVSIREIGRLREITFRAAGEGSGKALDLDQFDPHYLHLMVWNRAKREVVGAYRLGLTDRILSERGVAGLYTYELFDYRRDMLDRLGPALEMGRSFVRAEYQRSFTPLLLLWKGIGKFVVDHPQYRYLFGPVSISGAYQSMSVQLMVQFLRLHHGQAADPTLQSQVAARTPFVPAPARNWDERQLKALVTDEDALSDLVADLETDQKGLPVLIRQYLKLGAKFLSFNVDRAFGDCVDGLILVDLPNADRKVTERYLGKTGLASYLAHHRAAGVTV